MTSSLLLAAIFVGLLIVLLMVRLEIAFAILAVGALWILFIEQPSSILVTRAFSGVNSFTLLAIPFFLIAGELMNNSGITSRLVRVANLTVGRARGGLAYANISSSVVFAGISGAAVADTAAIGSVFIPQMEEEGYDVDFSASVTAASSIIGPIIPPSVIMIIYGAITDTSVGALFVAGVIPGLILALALFAAVFVIAQKNDLPRYQESIEYKEVPKLFTDSIMALTMPGIILFGIVFGVFTATEAAAVACGYAVLVGVLYFGELNLGGIHQAVAIALERSVQLYVIIGFAIIFAWILGMENIPAELATLLEGMGLGPVEFLLLTAVILILLGMWLEIGAAVVILAPTLLQIATSLGIHPVHFGIVMIVTLCFGLITPPLGVCLFVASSVADIDVWPIAKQILPFYVSDIIVLVLIIVYPEISLYLPRQAGLI